MVNVFDILNHLNNSINQHAKDYSKEYVSGYIDCLRDMETKLKDQLGNFDNSKL